MTPVWSGGVAFSYFPAVSVQGNFGMVTISPDGSNVTISSDFSALEAQYGQVNAPNAPNQSSAGSTNYPSCPAQNATWLASTTLPPTPNDKSCQCLESDLSCQFTPQTNNYTAIVGELLDNACGLLAQAGGNCNDIAGSGANGTYGRVSFCDPREHPYSLDNVAFRLTKNYIFQLPSYLSCLAHTTRPIIAIHSLVTSLAMLPLTPRRLLTCPQPMPLQHRALQARNRCSPPLLLLPLAGRRRRLKVLRLEQAQRVVPSLLSATSV